LSCLDDERRSAWRRRRPVPALEALLLAGSLIACLALTAGLVG
jgi:hypothetical protein